MSTDWRELAAVFAGGTIGAVARAEVSQSLLSRPGQWPWATFSVNVAGAFLLGCFATDLGRRSAPSPYRLSFLGTGFCGALTTFSTVQLELLWMLDRGETALTLAYGLASVVAGLGAVLVAALLVRGRRGWA